MPSLLGVNQASWAPSGSVLPGANTRTKSRSGSRTDALTETRMRSPVATTGVTMAAAPIRGTSEAVARGAEPAGGGVLRGRALAAGDAAARIFAEEAFEVARGGVADAFGKLDLRAAGTTDVDFGAPDGAGMLLALAEGAAGTVTGRAVADGIADALRPEGGGGATDWGLVEGPFDGDAAASPSADASTVVAASSFLLGSAAFESLVASPAGASAAGASAAAAF